MLMTQTSLSDQADHMLIGFVATVTTLQHVCHNLLTEMENTQ